MSGYTAYLELPSGERIELPATMPDITEAERAYTLKIRQGCEGGGKGPLVQTELSATLATRQDQSLIQRAAGFGLGNSGGIGYSEECSPTLMTGAGGNKTAVVYRIKD